MVACCAIASEMPTFVTVSIYDSSCSKMLLEWTILDEDDECEDCQDKRKILKKKKQFVHFSCCFKLTSCFRVSKR